MLTQGLTHILQTHKDARAAMAAVVKQLTGADIDDSLTWIPEAKQADGARPDLETRTPTAATTPFNGLIQENFGGSANRWRDYANTRWSGFDSSTYEDAIADFRASLHGEPLWKIEQFWRGRQ